MVQYGERIYGLWGQNILGPNPTFACYLSCVTLDKSLNVCSCRKCDRSADVLRGLGAEQTVAASWLTAFAWGLTRPLHSQTGRNDSAQHIFKKRCSRHSRRYAEVHRPEANAFSAASLSSRKEWATLVFRIRFLAAWRYLICDWVLYTPNNSLSDGGLNPDEASVCPLKDFH